MKNGLDWGVWRRGIVAMFAWLSVQVWKPEADIKSCVFLDYYPSFLRQGLLLNPKLLNSTKLTDQMSYTPSWAGFTKALLVFCVR